MGGYTSRSDGPVKCAELNDASGEPSPRGPGGALAIGNDRPWLVRYEGGSLGEAVAVRKSAVSINGPRRPQAYDIMVILVGPQFIRSTVWATKFRY